jgi:hypothetical protein
MVIEPVLLSLCCYQLNRRRAPGARIDKALVLGAGQDILDSFYRDALDDPEVKGPPEVARFIEDHLVQGGRFRGDYPNQEALAEGKLTRTQLAALTDRHRLVRIVQYTDTARIELIHDRLVPVVCKARDERKNKAEQDEQERLAREAQAERDKAQAERHKERARSAELRRQRDDAVYSLTVAKRNMALTFGSLGLIIIVPLLVPGVEVPEAAARWLWAAGLLAIVWGVMIACGFKKVPLPWGAIDVPMMSTTDVPDVDHRVVNAPPRELPREVEEQRRDYAARKEQELPGRFAPAFQLLNEKLAFTVTPCADPMTPMYILDREFRIMDWNIAFSLCFDRTLEGRRGRNVLEWTYFLDNYEEVVKHGIGVIRQGTEPPRIDIEEIRYTSYRYGPIKGTKRAYQYRATTAPASVG